MRLRFSLLLMLMILLGCRSNAPAKPVHQAGDLFKVNIRYFAPQAKKVFMVWGIDDWKSLPEELWPGDTKLKSQVMFTQMRSSGEYFTAELRVPSGSYLDYGFLTVELQNGQAVEIWEENIPPGTHLKIQEEQLIETKAEELMLVPRAQPDLGEYLPAFLLNLVLAVIIFFIYQFTPEKNRQLMTLAVLGLILICGLSVRLTHAVEWNRYHPNTPERLIGDEPGYDQLAREALAGNGFTWPGRVPLYPLMLAAIYWFSDGSYNAVTIAQSFLGLAAILLTFELGRRMFNPATGLIAAAWAALSIVLVRQPLRLLSEAIYTPFLLLVLLALWKAWQVKSLRQFILLGFLIGISNLIRPTLLLFPIYLLVLLVFHVHRSRALQFAMVVISVSVLVVLPWMIHNFWRYQAIFPLQTSNAILWQGSPEYYHLVHDEGYTYLRIWQEVLYGPGWEQQDPNSLEGERYWNRRALRSIAAEPGVYLKYAGEKMITYWIGDPNADWGDTYVFNYRALREVGYNHKDALQLIIARMLPLVALVALFLLRSHWRNLIPALALILYFNLLHAITHAEARLSEPLHPILLIFTAAALLSIFDRSKVLLLTGSSKIAETFIDRCSSFDRKIQSIRQRIL